MCGCEGVGLCVRAGSRMLTVVPTQVAFEDIPVPVGDTTAEDLDDASPRTHVSWATMAILATLSAFASVSMQ